MDRNKDRNRDRNRDRLKGKDQERGRGRNKHRNKHRNKVSGKRRGTERVSVQDKAGGKRKADISLRTARKRVDDKRESPARQIQQWPRR